MFYDTLKNDHSLRYNPFKSLAVPRPIGWISTLSKDGVVNLAPYSFFNALSYNPAYVVFSAGRRTDGSIKDSVINAEETGEFVFNMATWDLREQMNVTGWIEEPGVDEMAEAKLTPAPSRMVKPPRVAESPVHFECLYHQTVVLPGGDAAHEYHVVFGKVVGVHVKDEFITGDGLIDVLKIRPIARLGYKDYTSVDSVFSMDKRTPEDDIKPAAAE